MNSCQATAVGREFRSGSNTICGDLFAGVSTLSINFYQLWGSYYLIQNVEYSFQIYELLYIYIIFYIFKKASGGADNF